MSRKEKTYHFIYKTTDTRNGNFYIGMHSTDNLNDGYVGSGDRLKKLIYKHGKEIFNIEILEFFPNRNSLKQREKEIVNSDLLKEEKCMNLCFGGSGGFISLTGVKKGREVTDKILREKYGDNFRTIINKNYRDRLTDEQKEVYYKKIKLGQINSNFDYGKSFRGKNLTKNHKEKIGIANSITQKGEKNSQFGTCWITNGIENKKIKKDQIIPDGWKLGRKL